LRLFIALPLPADIVEYLGRTIEALRATGPDVRWVDPGNVHLTVRFLGETDAAVVPRLTALLDGVAAQLAPTTLTLDRMGAFPNLRRPNVFWVGLAGNTERLSKLARQVELGVRTLRFEKEKKGFKPHLTLGRVKRGRTVTETVSQIEAMRIEPREVLFDQVVLFQSDLTPQGAVYTRLHTARLGVERFGG